MTIVKFKQTVKRKGAKVVQFCFALKNKQGELTELHCYKNSGSNRNRGLDRFLVSNPKYNRLKIVNE